MAKPLSTIISLFPINLQRLMPECDPLHSYLRQLNKPGVGRPDAICFVRRGEVPSFRSTVWDTIGVPSPVRNFPAVIHCADAICVCSVATPAPQMTARYSSYLEEIRPLLSRLRSLWPLISSGRAKVSVGFTQERKAKDEEVAIQRSRRLPY